MTDLHRIIPHRLHVPEKWRALIEEEVERLVRILDRIDGDPEIEPQGDEEPDSDGEPELGWTDREATTSGYARDSATGSIDVGEPSLGSLECMNQRRWWLGRNDDAEEQCEGEGDEHDGREPDTDREGLTTEFRGGAIIGADAPAPDYPQSNS